MSVDDDDPRHLTACRSVLAKTTEMLISNRKRNAILVTDNDMLRAQVADLQADIKAIQAGVCLRDVVGCDSLHHGAENELVCTTGERKVLKAAAWGSVEQLQRILDMCGYSAWIRMTVGAELENRAAKEAAKADGECNE
jgi:hypothetical protein